MGLQNNYLGVLIGGVWKAGIIDIGTALEAFNVSAAWTSPHGFQHDYLSF